MVTPPKKIIPKFKVDHFSKHVIKISMDDWLLGIKFSCDEQMQCLQGNIREKGASPTKQRVADFSVILPVRMATPTNYFFVIN